MKFSSGRRAITKVTAIIIAVIVIVVAVGGYFAWLSMAGPSKPEKKEIVIGAAISLTGKYAKSGKWYKQAYEMWRDEVNAQGGIYVKEYGRKLPVRLILYDDASDPEKGVSLYEKLITVDKVDFILSAYSSAIVYATSAIAEKYGYLYLDVGGASKKIFQRGFKYVFGVMAGVAREYTKGLFDWLKTLPADQRPKSIAFLGEDSEFPRDNFDGLKEYAAELGIPIVVSEFYAKGTTDLTPLISKAKAAGAEMLIGGTYFPDSVLMVQTAKALNYNPKIIWLSVGPSMVPDFPNALGEDANYVMCSVHFMPYPTTKYNKEFVKKFRERYGVDPDYHAALGYAGCQVLQQAIEATGTLDNKKLRDYVATHEFTTVIGKLKFKEDGTPYYAMILIQYQKGKPEIIWPEEVRTAEPVYPMPTWEERGAK